MVSDLVRRLNSAVCRETSNDPDRCTWANPAWGQCAVVALVVQDELGGTLLRAIVNGGSHYLNLLPNAEVLDLTINQFPAACRSYSEVEPRTRKYVMGSEATRNRYALLRKRFDDA